MREGGAGISGLGSFLPPTLRGNDYWGTDFKSLSEKERREDLIDVELTAAGTATQVPPEIAAAMAPHSKDPFHGAKQRYVIDDGAEPSDLEAEAGRRAMRAAGVAPHEIDLAMVYSMVSDRLTPSNAGAVQAKCELSNATAWNLEGACTTFLPMMLTADAFIRAGTFHRILLVLSSAASRVMDYSTSASTVFGDGAAAAVVTAAPKGYGIIGHWARTDGSFREGVVFAPIVDGKPQKRWQGAGGPIKLCSFDVAIGKQMGLRSTEYCKEACLGALHDAGISIGDIALYVGGQSVPWFVDACRRALGLSVEQTVDTFPEVGNLGAATLPFNLERAWRQGRLRDGDLVLSYIPGAGLTWSAFVYRWRSPKGG
jgi:3-oxoacyl-[acyl-carrier-protein] synthase-3